MSKVNDPSLKSWIEVKKDSDFPIQNIPFGIFSPKDKSPRPGTIIGNTVIDLSVLAEDGYFDDIINEEYDAFFASSLNDFIALGKEKNSLIRDKISELFRDESEVIRDDEKLKSRLLYNQSEVDMHMPVEVGDYTDFYSSIEHATNVGTMFRDPDNALFPNWKSLPVGYHGRASSIVVSGTDIHRPNGQTMPADAEKPVFGPCRLFDFELEMAFITRKSNKLGNPIKLEDAEDYIFGMVIFNDLSARDIQKWEYVPLGPFLAKNFGSVISPWIVTLDALEPFRVEGPKQEPEVLPYLKFKGKRNFDIKLEVALKPENNDETIVSKSNHKYLYWNIAQQLTHQTVNGCNINPGDMYASGTISGPTKDSYGSMLELSWAGKNPIKLNDGSERKFVNDNDTIIMRGYCESNGHRIGFGESVCKVLPAKKY
ncbi:MAG: fumarylacetoacetase [Marinilabiliales bacterium]|nr:MAG: fumarylacetoacetase [Marinilabiliales bacterium]